MDLTSGQRGERYCHVESLLCELTGAEAAITVNNNAAAVLLALSALAQGKEAIVSRGELVEIGGSFRVPDIMKLSGAILKEVGTTNRTHPKDYRSAITTETAIIMKVHASNFAMSGFTVEVDAKTLAALGKEHDIPVMADIGSGNLADFSSHAGYGEPTLPEYINAGIDIVTCSGDKLLGGPQAGILLGRKAIIDRLRTHPLLRAIRIDKLTLAALEATLLLYRDERQALNEIPTLKMLLATAAELRAKGRRYLRNLHRQLPPSVRLSLVEGESQVGGGAMPLSKPETVLISVDADGWAPHEIDETFRRHSLPIVGRINKGRYLLDLRTLMDEDLSALQEALPLLSTEADSSPAKPHF
jgi:L-seryl-tRNA(Ser) seleniumtransferase